ncbi:polynucleotide 5'-hydroxyl-kinase NOL9, partial [Tanacetum coccineum]
GNFIVKFILNLEEDDVEPSVILGRSFMRLAKGVADFGNGVITIHLELDPFLDDSEETEKFEDDWDHMLDINFGDLPENNNTERSVIETMAYSDKYKKIMDGIVMDKIKLDGEIKKEEEEAIKQVKGEALQEKEGPGAFIIPIRLEAKIDLNALADTSSDINVMSYRIYAKLGREEVKKVNRGITMMNHSKAEPMGVLKDVLCQVGVSAIISKFLILDMPIAKTSLNTEESYSDDEEDYGFLGSFPVPLQHMEWKPDYKGSFCKKEEGDGQWHAKIRLTDPYGNVYDQGPYVRPVIPDPDDTMKQIIEPLSKTTEINKKQYIVDVRVMNYRLLMYCSEVTNHVRHSRLMDEFDKFVAKEGESLESVYERLITLVNIMDRKANVQCYNCNEKGHYARDCLKPRVGDAKYFKEQKLLSMKDEAESNLNAEENDFMLDNFFGDETLEELTAAIIMMAQIQLADGNTVTEPTYDAKVVCEVNASHKAHEQVNHVTRKTIIHSSDDDQINSNIIFDDPYVENNGGTSEHDLNVLASFLVK